MLWSNAFCCIWVLSLDPSGNCRNKSLELSDGNSILKRVARDSQLNVVTSRNLESGLLLHLNKRLLTQIVLFRKISLIWKSYFSANFTVKCFCLFCQYLTCHLSDSVKMFSISSPVLLIKMQFTLLGRIWYSKNVSSLWVRMYFSME